MAKRFLVLTALLMLGFFMAGCSEGDESGSVVNPNPEVFAPTGSISGVVYDYCTLVPVKGAVVSVAYGGKTHSVTTGTSGAFSFNNVPANHSVIKGYGYNYTVTCDLTKVTGYGYALIEDVDVEFTSLHDGLNEDMAEEVTESGSGASTPVDKLAATLEFAPGPLTSGISGSIYDVSTGRALSGATVSLYYGARYLSSVTSTDGTYSFTGIWPSTSYKLMVSKAGYEYAALQASNTVGSASCNLVPVSCNVGCGQTLAGVNVNMIANPAKDKTIPYIVSVRGGGETDIIDGDEFTALENTDVTSLVFTFSEGMQASRTIKNNAVTLSTAFTCRVTSAGTSTTNPVYEEADVNLIDSDYTVTMTSAGVMTITTPYIDEAAIKAAVLLADPSSDIVGTANIAAAALTIGSGSYTVNFVAYNNAGSAHLTDLSYNPWTIGILNTTPADPGEVDALGYLHAFGEAYQDYFILGGGHSLTFYVGE